MTKVEQYAGNFTAIVQGTQEYRVSVSGRNYKHGHCTCYVGEKGTLCKHMVALAIYAVLNGKSLSLEDMKQRSQLMCSDRRAMLTDEEFALVKASITEAMRYVKPYRGPSRTWFANQNSLQEGCAHLAAIVSQLPVHEQTAELLVKLLLRLDRKLQVGGVDDSNGIVGGFMSEVVGILMEYAKIEPRCIDVFGALAGRQTCFQWEDLLVRLYDERDIK